ncbi:MAG TPA: hypothetical protein VI456_04990 [Polyangia bacterium]
MKGNYVAALAVSFVALGAGGCGRHGAPPPRARQAALADAVRPDFLAAALRKLGGAHYHATLKYGLGRAGVAPRAITTTTDVWLDRAGNWRLREENDRDGGREVVLHGRELSVALRYGRMIRRVAEEPEPSRLLEEGLGAPWAAYELCASRLQADAAAPGEAGRAADYTLALGTGTAVVAPVRALPLTGLRAWRGAAAIETLSGRASIDGATGALLSFDLTTTFTARGESGPEQGTVEVHATLSEVGATPAIEKPAAEELSLRQRTVPEARELLRGLADPERQVPARAASGAHDRRQMTGHK